MRYFEKIASFRQKLGRQQLILGSILLLTNWYLVSNLVRDRDENFFWLGSGIPHCECKRKVAKTSKIRSALDIRLQLPSGCSDFSTSRGSHQKVISYSFFGDVQVSLVFCAHKCHFFLNVCHFRFPRCGRIISVKFPNVLWRFPNFTPAGRCECIIAMPSTISKCRGTCAKFGVKTKISIFATSIDSRGLCNHLLPLTQVKFQIVFLRFFSRKTLLLFP